MASTDIEKLDSWINALFRDFEVTGLRINDIFVEFHYRNVADPRAGNEIDFNILQKLHRRLKPKRMSINGWTEVSGCEECRVEKHYGYVVAYLK